MNRIELKAKLDEIGIDQDFYSLEGDLQPDRIVLYENYSQWEVFYFSERGDRDDFHVFHSEDEACQYIFHKFKSGKDNTTPRGFLAKIPSVVSKEDLFVQLSEKLQFPRTPCMRWDTLKDLLCDFSWIENGRAIIIYHEEMSRLPSEVVKKYTEVISEVNLFWDKASQKHEIYFLFCPQDRKFNTRYEQEIAYEQDIQLYDNKEMQNQNTL